MTHGHAPNSANLNNQWYDEFLSLCGVAKGACGANDRRKINKHRELLRGFFASACAKLSANGK
eukprot:1156073-Amphidinium_carterae.1